VIEAATENLDLKIKILGQLEAVAPPPGKVYRSGQTGRAADGSPKDPAAAPARQPALPLRDPTTAGG
ncbi:hypothetical protein, partial [Ralstonia pseudosolanacearum]|uniref:hypothetical protein n=1 Tax=Ralstonia pseudosolanacearum TaxID=1310165 RepID=UPI003CF5B6B9